MKETSLERIMNRLVTELLDEPRFTDELNEAYEYARRIKNKDKMRQVRFEAEVYRRKMSYIKSLLEECRK